MSAYHLWNRSYLGRNDLSHVEQADLRPDDVGRGEIQGELPAPGTNAAEAAAAAVSRIASVGYVRSNLHLLNGRTAGNVAIANQVIVGVLGATAIAAVGFANSLIFILVVTFGALGVSVSILVARAFGGEQRTGFGVGMHIVWETVAHDARPARIVAVLPVGNAQDRRVDMLFDHCVSDDSKGLTRRHSR